MAPQMEANEPHGMPFDIWCIGILIYELLTGDIPVTEKDKPKQPPKQYPDFISRAAQDMMKKLLVRDPEKRMTIEELKDHIWLCQNQKKIVKIRSSEKVNKL